MFFDKGKEKEGLLPQISPADCRPDAAIPIPVETIANANISIVKSSMVAEVPEIDEFAVEVSIFCCEPFTPLATVGNLT